MPGSEPRRLVRLKSARFAGLPKEVRSPRVSDQKPADSLSGVSPAPSDSESSTWPEITERESGTRPETTESESASCPVTIPGCIPASPENNSRVRRTRIRSRVMNLFGEETKEATLNTTYDFHLVIGPVYEIKFVHIDDNFGAEIISINPRLVVFVELLEIFYSDS